MKNKLIAFFSFILLICSLSIGFIFFKPTSNFKIGDFIQFGKYNNSPILWRIVNIDNNSPKLITENIICFKAFDSSGKYHELENRYKYGSNYWANSNIRQWLNSNEKQIKWLQNPPNSSNVYSSRNPYDQEQGFLFESNFTNSQYNLILSKSTKTLVSQFDENNSIGGNEILNLALPISKVSKNYGKGKFMQTTDRVRLLSISEIYEYIVKNNFSISKKPTKSALNQNTYKELNIDTNDNFYYMLRDSNQTSSHQVMTIYDDLKIHYGAYYGCDGVVVSIDLKNTIKPQKGKGTKILPYIIE